MPKKLWVKDKSCRFFYWFSVLAFRRDRAGRINIIDPTRYLTGNYGKCRIVNFITAFVGGNKFYAYFAFGLYTNTVNAAGCRLAITYLDGMKRHSLLQETRGPDIICAAIKVVNLKAVCFAADKMKYHRAEIALNGIDADGPDIVPINAFQQFLSFRNTAQNKHCLLAGGGNTAASQNAHKRGHKPCFYPIFLERSPVHQVITPSLRWRIAVCAN